MNIADPLEKVFHLEAVIRIEEEEQTLRIVAIRRYETEILIYLMNRLFQHMSVMSVGSENNTPSSDGQRNGSRW